MVEILSTTKPIARKEHKCNFCGGKILIGEAYDNQVLKYDHLYTWKSHLRCVEIARKLGMFDECDEGVSGEDFHEFINEEFYKLEGEQDLNKILFKDRLDSVCNHYLKRNENRTCRVHGCNNPVNEGEFICIQHDQRFHEPTDNHVV